MTRSHWCALALLPCLTLAACNRSGGTRSDAPRIALVLKTLNSPFFNDMQRGAQAAAARLGVDLVVQAAEREVDVDRQMQIVENVLQTGVQALCLTPAGSRELVPAVVKANRSNVPVGGDGRGPPLRRGGAQTRQRDRKGRNRRELTRHVQR